MQLAPVALAALAYALRARTLRRRGTPLPAWRLLLFGVGITLLVLAFASPIAAIGEQELFSFHMLQHVLIGDLAPLCLLAGLSGPLLRPLLALRPVERLRVLANPVVALPLFALFFSGIGWATVAGVLLAMSLACASASPPSRPV